MEEDFIIVLDEPIIIPEQKKIEYRLYYNDDGSILYYTTEDLPGKYILISRQEYSEGRPDVRVENEKLVRLSDKVILSKMSKSSEGIKCASEDINILVNYDYTGETTQWELKRYEF